MKKGLNERALILSVAIIAMISPFLHIIGDIMKLIDNGYYSVTSLVIIYISFTFLPLVVVGIFALHWQKLGWLGFIGTILYSLAFVYFASTAINPLVHMHTEVVNGALSFSALAEMQGFSYVLHGVFMTLGGILFAVSLIRSGALPKLAGVLLITGVIINVVFNLIPIGPLFAMGTIIRNTSFIFMGIYLLKKGMSAKQTDSNILQKEEAA